MILENTQEIVKKLQTNEWINKPVGYYKTKTKGQNTIYPIKGFEMFIRDTNFDKFFKNLSNTKSENQHKIRVSGWGSGSPMGNPKGGFNPQY